MSTGADPDTYDLIRRAVTIAPQEWRPDPPDAETEVVRIVKRMNDSPELRDQIVRTIAYLKSRNRSDHDLDACLHAITEERYTVCARYPWNRPIRFKSGAAMRPWASPLAPGALTHTQAFVREIFHVVNAQYTYDHCWSLVCSYEDDPFHHDISRFILDMLERYYRDDRMSAEWDPHEKKMKCVVTWTPAPAQFVHKSPTECAIDIIRVMMDALFSGADAYWADPDMGRPKNIVQPDRDWCIVHPPHPMHVHMTWPKRARVLEKLHGFFGREIDGHTVLDILTHRVPKERPASAEDKALLENIKECVTLTAILLKGHQNVRWSF